jgi:hypothetical protein
MGDGMIIWNSLFFDYFFFNIYIFSIVNIG